MSVVEKLTLGVVILFIAVAFLKLLKTPLRLALRLVGNTVLGFALVWLTNRTGSFTGLSLGLNWFTGLTVGILGVPGLLLLLLVKWVLV